MAEVRLGRQIPTNEVILPYENSYGNKAIELYEKSGRKAQEWQTLLISDILSYNSDDLWIHTKFGYSVPRRNGKNEVVAIREMFGLFNNESMLHTAHRTATSSSAFKRLLKILTDSGYKEKEDFKVQRQYGLEQIIMNEGGQISFRTRTDTGGLGEGFDLLVIDEAQEYKDTQETTLKYVVSSSKNPQTIFCGTPPTPVSSGTVFVKMRKDVLSGTTLNAGWAEWSVDQMSPCNDKELWYETNPSLGTILTERIIQDEIGTDDLDFNIQRLGYWTKTNLKSFISANQWNELKCDKLPKLKGKLFVGIKYGKDGTNVTLSIAVKTKDDKVFVETYNCKPQHQGNSWIYDFCNKADIEKLVIDCSAGVQEILIQAYRDKLLTVKPYFPTVKEFMMSSEVFMTGLEQKKICHKGQPSLLNSVSNCQKRLIGTNGGFGFKTIKESIDISLMESMVLAFWACNTTKVKTRTTISY